MSSVCQAPQVTNLSPTFPVITGAAFVDSINPCAIAVLLILLTGLLSLESRRKVWLTGFSFILALYITYFALGIGILGILNLSGLASIFHRFIGTFAILIGILNVKDFFWYGGGGFATEIPRSWRPALKKILERATSPLSAFLIGIVVTLFELPCTGGPYVFVLGLLFQNTAWAKIIPILLYYNLIFVLPLIVLTFLLYFGYSTVEKATAWKERHIETLHLAAGVIMIGLGLWVFWN